MVSPGTDRRSLLAYDEPPRLYIRAILNRDWYSMRGEKSSGVVHSPSAMYHHGRGLCSYLVLPVDGNNMGATGKIGSGRAGEVNSPDSLLIFYSFFVSIRRMYRISFFNPGSSFFAVSQRMVGFIPK